MINLYKHLKLNDMQNTLLRSLDLTEKAETGFLKEISIDHKSSHFPSKPANTRNSLPFSGKAASFLARWKDSSGKAASFLARWKDSPGPIGQAIRDKDYGFLLTAIREAKNKKAL